MCRARLPSVNFQHISQNAHACHGICILWPLDAALPMRFAKNTPHDTSKALRLPRKLTMDTSKVLRLPRKLQRIFGKRRKSNCACHTKRLSTRYKTRLNVTKCHACHAKRSNETFETSKNDPFCRTYHRHGHIAIARTVANGWATSSKHTLNPQTPRVKREPLLPIREQEKTWNKCPKVWNIPVNDLLALFGCPRGTSVNKTRRRMARERRGAESSVVSMETLYYKTIY